MDSRFPWEPPAPQPAPETSHEPLALNPVEVRVLGCLIEKQATTPDTYPLTLNALDLACNQTTNREPVTSYDPGTIERAVETLRQKGLVWVVRGGRATKYDQRFAERLALDPAGLAAMCVLMLRGPQTVGEIRSRTGRLHAFASLEEVEATLATLMGADPPLVTKLPRAPGAKEARYAQLVGDAAETGEDRPAAVMPATAAPAPAATAPAEPSQLARLEQEVETLRRELEELRREFQELKSQLE